VLIDDFYEAIALHRVVSFGISDMLQLYEEKGANELKARIELAFRHATELVVEIKEISEQIASGLEGFEGDARAAATYSLATVEMLEAQNELRALRFASEKGEVVRSAILKCRSTALESAKLATIMNNKLKFAGEKPLHLVKNKHDHESGKR
tara:strand:- start:21495 stop:21950 length:456 start_codon:yes stop_codon:yes gene_type:complete